MSKRTRTYWIWAIAIGALLLVLLGTRLSEVAATALSAKTTTQSEARSAAMTTTTASDEGAAANLLEAQIIGVYESASPSVVSITNRSYV
jgi:hypothetical protein